MDDFEGTNFVDRKAELKLLNAYSKLSGLLIVLGRRRIGKTALLRRWLSKHRGLYSQAIEAARNIQLSQVVEDFSEEFVFPARPGSWIELLRLLDQDKKQKIICLDEFQYLVKADPSLPSVLQRWLDHENKSKNLIVLSGSSTKIMTETCIHANSPLYGRARQVIHLQPIAYPFFCEYLSTVPSLTRFSSAELVLG